jgi:hypothetical protein
MRWKIEINTRALREHGALVIEIVLVRQLLLGFTQLSLNNALSAKG